MCAQDGKSQPKQNQIIHKPVLQAGVVLGGKTRRPIHTVKQGDTLYEIARANRLTVREIKEANHLRGDRLRIGLRLTLPSLDTLNRAARGRLKPPSAIQVAAGRGSSGITTDDVGVGDPPGSVPTTEGALEQAPEGLAKNPDGLGPEEAPQALRYRLASAGFDFLGVPYRWRGMSEARGFDCSGLVKKLFDKFQIDLPHSAREQFKLGEKVAKAELEIGDLVFFASRGKIPTHVGIYIGDNQFLHAASKARQVIISNLGQKWYTKRFLGARRISDLWKDEQKPAEVKGN